jgi:hypothetical protein
VDERGKGIENLSEDEKAELAQEGPQIDLRGVRVRPTQQPVQQEWFKFRDSSGKSWHVHPEDWPEIQKRDKGAKRLD